MKRKQHLQSSLSVCLVRLQDMHNMQENVRQSKLQLVFLQTTKAICNACRSHSRRTFFLIVHRSVGGAFDWDRRGEFESL